MRHVRTIVMAAGVLALVLGGSTTRTTVAQQAEPLLGCVKPGTGLLRVVQPGETCKGQETPLGFNDLPLLVALRNTVLQLQARVEALEERVETLEACAAQLCGGE